MTVTATTLERRTRALRTKLTSLTEEIAAWSVMPKAAAFAMHQSQIEDVCGGLAEMHALIAREIDDAEREGKLSLESVTGFERKILAALHIWECYRSKFVLRLVEKLRDPLALVDDLAWQAYRPARDRAVASKSVTAVDVREPPLVFPNVRWSPFARSREQAYELDEGTGDVHALADFDQWLRAIPVPLVGIPWYQMTHLPDAGFIGHEVGHLVEEDLGLEESLRSAILTALPDATEERRVAWSRRWRSEVFADVYGVLTTGSAYAAVLLDVLAGDPDGIAAESQPDASRTFEQQWSAYPTRALRARVVCEAVRRLPSGDPDPTIFSDRAAELEASWIAAHPKHAMEPYEDDVGRVVGAILATPLSAFGTGGSGDGMPITSVLTFTPDMERTSRRDARAANEMRPVTAGDIRTLFAGVAHAFVADPRRFEKAASNERFRKQMVVNRTRGRRAVAVAGFKPADPAARHRAVAAALYARVTAPGGP